MSNSLSPWTAHARLPCPSPTPGAYSNSCPSSRWCHPTISSSVVPFSSCFWSLPASGSFPMSEFFASGDQSIGVSASVLPMNIQDWLPLRLTGLISLQCLAKNHTCNTILWPRTSSTVQRDQELTLLEENWDKHFAKEIKAVLQSACYKDQAGEVAYLQILHLVCVLCEEGIYIGF